MKPLAIVLAAAVAGSSLPVLRPSNSKQLTESGRTAFVEGRFDEAFARLSAAAELSDAPAASFNAASAAIAVGRTEDGALALETIASQPGPLGVDARFNQGNAFLMRQQWDEAIERYTDALRRDPRAADAKRNLEIALQRRAAEQQESDRGEPRPQPTPSAGEQPQESRPLPGDREGKQEMSPEEILRSIAEQEREELQRMRRERAGERRAVGW